jgi:hypothetical protein
MRTRLYEHTACHGAITCENLLKPALRLGLAVTRGDEPRQVGDRLVGADNLSEPHVDVLLAA